MNKSFLLLFFKKEALAFLYLFGLTVVSAHADDKVALMTDWSAEGTQAPLFLAQSKGWLKDAGLDVSIQDGKGSNNTVKLVAAGTVDVGFVQLSSMAAGIDQGMALTSIAGFIRAGDNGVVVPVDSPIHEPKDLLGKRIVYALGGGSAGMMDAFFSAAHLPRSELKLVGVDASAIASTYVAGNVDAAVSTVAFLLPLVNDKRPSRAIPYASVGLNLPGYGLTVRTADVAPRAAVFAKLVPVIDRVWGYVKDGHVPEAIDAILAARSNERLDRDMLIAQLNGYLLLMDTPATKGHPIGWQAESDWSSASAALHTAGLLKNDVPATAYFTNQFVQP
jgi:NitT/TauT family transport system substrate-binding protein